MIKADYYGFGIKFVKAYRGKKWNHRDHGVQSNHRRYGGWGKMKPQRPRREIMFKNSVNSLVFADKEAFPLNCVHHEGKQGKGLKSWFIE